MSYAHPYLTPNGNIIYYYFTYPCPDSKKWEVLGNALEQNTKKLYEDIVQYENDENLKEQALQLYILSVVINNYLRQAEEIKVIISNALKNIVGNKTNKNNSKRYRNNVDEYEENKKKILL